MAALLIDFKPIVRHDAIGQRLTQGRAA